MYKLTSGKNRAVIIFITELPTVIAIPRRWLYAIVQVTWPYSDLYSYQTQVVRTVRGVQTTDKTRTFVQSSFLPHKRVYIAGLLERLDFAKAGFSITIHPAHDVRKNALISVLYTCLAPDTRSDPKTMQTVLFFSDFAIKILAGNISQIIMCVCNKSVSMIRAPINKPRYQSSAEMNINEQA